MLFRCEACPNAFCEDCLPRDAAIIGNSARLEARGVRLPLQACYIRCSSRCHAFMVATEGKRERSKTNIFPPLELEPLCAEEDDAEGEGAQAGDGDDVGGSTFAKLFNGMLGDDESVNDAIKSKFHAELCSVLLQYGEHDDGRFYSLPSSGKKRSLQQALMERLFGVQERISSLSNEPDKSIPVKKRQVWPLPPLHAALAFCMPVHFPRTDQRPPARRSFTSSMTTNQLHTSIPRTGAVAIR